MFIQDRVIGYGQTKPGFQIVKYSFWHRFIIGIILLRRPSKLDLSAKLENQRKLV